MKSIHLPDDVYQRAAELAEQDKVSVDRLVAALVYAHAREWSRLRGRAARGSKEKLKSVLAKVGDTEPEAIDRL
jgi:predicted DNA-binding ribbon-helix-helix protein